MDNKNNQQNSNQQQPQLSEAELEKIREQARNAVENQNQIFNNGLQQFLKNQKNK